ncbi:hypothetical protein C5167_034145 [Papaver somniferum]|uniref:Uncharacterized protein n=1 Tax=Papaver somniferum TaxID=3469 RepID=A0A4Y7KDP6_PAPSO|nr:hypothetical protein C5167_034145 [Papaver somniferum]
MKEHSKYHSYQIWVLRLFLAISFITDNQHPSPSLGLLFGTMFHMAHHSSTNRHFNEWTFMQLSFMESNEEVS